MQQKTPNVGANVFWLILCTKTENNICQKNWTISEPSTSSFTSSQQNPMFHEVSPPISSSEATTVVVLCIHGCLRLEEPLDHAIVAFVGCPVQRCCASGAAARSQATGRTQRNEGEKLSERNLGASKVEVLEIVTTQKSSLTLKNLTLWFWGCFDDIELAEKAMWTRLAVKMLCGNLKENKKKFHL